jgi:hypothetical protein
MFVRPRASISRSSDRGGRLAHAGADLEYLRRGAAEELGEVDRLERRCDAETRQQLLPRPLLRGREAALAQHKAADRPAG